MLPIKYKYELSYIDECRPNNNTITQRYLFSRKPVCCTGCHTQLHSDICSAESLFAVQAVTHTHLTGGKIKQRRHRRSRLSIIVYQDVHAGHRLHMQFTNLSYADGVHVSTQVKSAVFGPSGPSGGHRLRYDS